MDPAMQPINGISLERYAELGALISDFMNDQQRVAQTIQGAGVNLVDWEAAKTGWTARMQDMNLMGRVAMGADPSQVPANASPVQAAMMNPAYQA
ncbi:MAG: hypothetical protein ACXWP4_18245, partial [Polyangiales bacterium]